MRLFFAIFPTQDFIQDVKKIQDNLKNTFDSWRWIPIKQLHMTLFFIGEVEDSLLPAIIMDMKSVFEHPPMYFENPLLTLAPPHTFKKRLLWIQFDHQSQFTTLANYIYKKLSSKRLFLEKPKPLPHVTLARFKPRVITYSFPQNLRSGYLFSQPVLLSSHYSAKHNTHLYRQVYPDSAIGKL